MVGSKRKERRLRKRDRERVWRIYLFDVSFLRSKKMERTDTGVVELGTSRFL
jgi:hypothetical protein